MTPAEQHAATQAMNGTTPSEFMHTIVALGTILLVIWLAIVVFGLVQGMASKQNGAEEFMLWGTLAFFVVVFVAGLLFF